MIKNSQGIEVLANELLEQQQQESRKPKAFCEQILTAAASLFPTKLALKTSSDGANYYIYEFLSLVHFTSLLKQHLLKFAHKIQAATHAHHAIRAGAFNSSLISLPQILHRNSIRPNQLR